MRGFFTAGCGRSGGSLFPSMEAKRRSETAECLAPGERPGKRPKGGNGPEEVEETGAAIGRVESPGADVDRRTARPAPGYGGDTCCSFVRPAIRRARRCRFGQEQRVLRRFPLQNDGR